MLQGGSRKAAELLRSKGILTEGQLKGLIERVQRDGVSFEYAVISSGIMGKEELLELLSSEWKVPYVDISAVDPDPDHVKMIPEGLSRLHRMMIFGKQEGSLDIALSDPFNIFAVEDVRIRTGYIPRKHIAIWEDIKAHLDRIYQVGVATEAIMEAAELVAREAEEVSVVEEGGAIDLSSIEGEAQAAPVVKLVNAIILGAIAEGASDIHIEPFERKLITRYRVDGVLRVVPQFSGPALYRYHQGIIARIKIMTGTMDIAERRLPQDGRIPLRVGSKQIDLRVNSIPTGSYGESIVMRILDRSSIKRGLDELGFLPDTLEDVIRLLKKPYGIILVCGPTGSGKSTTLYAALNFLNTPEKKILTIENPVEYNLEGVVQVQTRPEIGLTFAEGLRAFLRQDPDIMMVGEIRDRETAITAIEAALTGHLVLSTIHTNDAPSAPARLDEMGVDSFLIASALEAALAQRLVRKVCPACKEKVRPTKEEMALFEKCGISPEEIEMCRGKGRTRDGKECPECRGSGYKGRMAIHELMIMNDEIRSLVMRHASASEIREVARRTGMRTLREDGMRKVALGLTTIEQVVYATVD
jgi:type IV pilus assembly protein PilB